MDAAARQAAYYTETAAHYDDVHLAHDVENERAIEDIVGLIAGLEVTSVLDVGAGTGRALRRLSELRPDLETFGVEPVDALLQQADPELSRGLVRGSALALPYGDASIDIVMETAVLHHVADPATAVREMCRVARKGVFLADANRFGQGRPLARVAKLALYRAGLWGPLVQLRTRGRGWFWSEGDGLFYSYSVYDSFDAVAEWADRTIVIGTADGVRPRSWFHPLLTSPHALLAGLRTEPPVPGRARGSTS